VIKIKIIIKRRLKTMAYVMYSGKMISDQIDAYLTNGVAETDFHDGELVALGDLVADTTYVA
jgi:hypothetical protein